jgi:hypothetical protein
MRRQEPNDVPEGLQLAGPVVSRPAGLEHDRRGWPLCEECEESIAGQSSFFVGMTRPMRYGNLKRRLCEIDGDGRMLHVDSSLPWPVTRPYTDWHDDAARQEESIPSLA